MGLEHVVYIIWVKKFKNFFDKKNLIIENIYCVLWFGVERPIQ